MKERPIIFSSEMVRAILDGRKTQTRRPIKPQPMDHHWNGMNGYRLSWWTSGNYWELAHSIPHNPSVDCENFVCPFGSPGDRLWVRETWRWHDDETLGTCVEYRADGEKLKPRFSDEAAGWKAEQASVAIDAQGWLPPIHMPSWVSRITLKITGIRVERLQDISEGDAIAEGSQIPCDQLPKSCQQATMTEREQFSRLWDSIYLKKGKGSLSWRSNPWVWVIETCGALDVTVFSNCKH